MPLHHPTPCIKIHLHIWIFTNIWIYQYIRIHKYLKNIFEYKFLWVFEYQKIPELLSTKLYLIISIYAEGISDKTKNKNILQQRASQKGRIWGHVYRKFSSYCGLTNIADDWYRFSYHTLYLITQKVEWPKQWKPAC